MTPISTAVYTVAVTGITGAGTLGLNLVDNGAIHDPGRRPFDIRHWHRSFNDNDQSFFAGPGPHSLAVADLTGDGNPDLVVADDKYGGAVKRATGERQRHFSGIRLNSALGLKTVFVTVGDINGDGKPDIVVANNGTAYVGDSVGSYLPMRRHLPKADYFTRPALRDLCGHCRCQRRRGP